MGCHSYSYVQMNAVVHRSIKNWVVMVLVLVFSSGGGRRGCREDTIPMEVVKLYYFSISFLEAVGEEPPNFVPISESTFFVIHLLLCLGFCAFEVVFHKHSRISVSSVMVRIRVSSTLPHEVLQNPLHMHQ